MESHYIATTPDEIEDKSTEPGKMGIQFFKGMPRDIRYEIGSYLSRQDLVNLKAVSTEFHGPINKAKFKYEHEKKELKWAKKAFSKVMKPTNKLIDKAIDPYTGTLVTLPLFLASGFLGLPNAVVAASATPIGFFAGAIKEAKDKVKTKIKENHANKHIRPFKGEQITFKKP